MVVTNEKGENIDEYIFNVCDGDVVIAKSCKNQCFFYDNINLIGYNGKKTSLSKELGYHGGLDIGRIPNPMLIFTHPLPETLRLHIFHLNFHYVKPIVAKYCFMDNINYLPRTCNGYVYFEHQSKKCDLNTEIKS